MASNRTKKDKGRQAAAPNVDQQAVIDWKADPVEGQPAPATPVSAPAQIGFAEGPVSFEQKPPEPPKEKKKKLRRPEEIDFPEIDAVQFESPVIQVEGPVMSPEKPGDNSKIGDKRSARVDGQSLMAAVKKAKSSTRVSSASKSVSAEPQAEVVSNPPADPKAVKAGGGDDVNMEGRGDREEEVGAEYKEDEVMADAQGTAGPELPPDSTPKVKKPRVKTEARKAKDKMKKKEKGEKKKLTEAMGKSTLETIEQRPSSGGLSTPRQARSTPGLTDTTDSSSSHVDKAGKVTKAGKARPLYKEVSAFTRALANGNYLQTQKCHSGDPSPDKNQICKAWVEMAKAHPAVPRPEEFLGYGKEYAIRFGTAEAAGLADGVEIRNTANGASEKCILTCSYNRSSRARVFVVSNTSVMMAPDIVGALKQAFPTDPFSLFQNSIYGFHVDTWAVSFAAPPKTTTNKIVFSGTSYQGKSDWSSPVVAAGEICPFCSAAMHQSLEDCQSLRYVASSEAAPLE